ncbi:helix-turn-helix transcriptional regulator [Myxococcus sp. CA056]|uniref:helix-turn-helix domain-containing protein n=1 Tax=unclassified Myxococcus TaxID=2648731 RepID=UPI00157A4A13|nr:MULTISPECIES: AraC family transcriptional regulator [unclassified Myxococcus]NTX17818.1 helix-turn-helix transcriptional regulator [Myxococcus sp. CA056]NTX39590.1 helix-turn-helix transcriptional regulator [Myxococcus sp. CA033]
MRRNFGNLASAPSTLPGRPGGYHLLGQGEAFDVRDCVCLEGAGSPAFGGQHPRVRISVVLSGVFHVRAREGAAVVGPGALLLGNRSAPYEYRHVDDGGDRSIVFDCSESLLEDALRSLGRHAHVERPFERVCIPASVASAEAVLLTHHALASGEAEALREAALTVMGTALTLGCEPGEASLAVSEPQARRIARSLRYIETHSAEDCSLETLAHVAGLASFHFLRVFRAMTGQTPRQFVIATRLRAAAAALRMTRARVTDVALEAGFGDLSHFTASFTRAFGVSPRAYRSRAGD